MRREIRIALVTTAVIVATSLLVGSMISAPTIRLTTPDRVRMTNVRDTQFTVSWITDNSEAGHVNYGPTNALGSIAYDDRGESTVDDTHHVTVRGLSPNTTYCFDIVSGGVTDDNAGQHYTVKTGPSIIPGGTDQVWGQVYKQDGSTPAVGAILYLTLRDKNGQGTSGSSAPVSVLVNEDGYWYTDLVNFRTADLSSLFSHSASGDELAIEVEGAGDGRADQVVDTGSDDPAPPIVLGPSHELPVYHLYLSLLANNLPSSCGDAHEPNDSSGEATPLTLEQTIQASICPANDRDVYALDVETPRTIIVEMTGMVSGTDFDMWLYDSDGAALVGSTNPNNADERIEHTPARTGRYYLMVFRPQAAPTNTGPYMLGYSRFAPPTETPNHPPNVPRDPSPPDGATDQPTNVTLTWAGGDPDGDAVTYDVYLEANDSTPDVRVSRNQAGTTYDPGTLEAGTHYYWKIVARDSHGASRAGPVWDLTTSTSTYPVEGSVVIAGGACCVGGRVGDTVSISVAFDATSPFADVTEMRTRGWYGGRCVTEDEMTRNAWGPFAPEGSFPTTVVNGWVGFYVSVQYRDAAGYLSSVYCDDISVEGIPSP